MNQRQKVPLWRDVRVWRLAGQVLAIAVVILVLLWLWGNLTSSLQRLGIELGFGFLNGQAAFNIGETPIEYQPTDSYTRALLVGLVNSLRLIVVGIVLTTLVGITVGVARLSDNWLVRQLALAYVEVLRNTPLLLQLLFWYFVVFLGLPQVQNRLVLPGSIYLSNRGLNLPWPMTTTRTGIWMIALAVGLGLAAGVWRWQTQIMLRQGSQERPVLAALAAVAVTVLAAWIFTGGPPFRWDIPQISDEQIQGGLRLSSEFAALLAGLTFYTAAFIAEIVRAGIQSVPRGQWEAARSLGLKPGLVMRLVIFPQALRVIIPPLTSQYLNLAKNSSLAVAIGYPDLYAVASTTFNQTGRAVEVILLIMAAYLTISLTIALAMNLYNRTVQLVER
jgi:general L-amino acid transport system permease protein